MVIYGIEFEAKSLIHLAGLLQEHAPELYENFITDTKGRVRFTEELRNPEHISDYINQGDERLDACLANIINEIEFGGEEVVYGNPKLDSSAMGLYIEAGFPWEIPEPVKNWTKDDAACFFEWLAVTLTGKTLQIVEYDYCAE